MQTPQSSHFGPEGGDQSINKVEPFPGYRDAEVVADEDGEWSEYTYDSDEERHKRNLFFGFLLMLLCCGLIIASIIIVYMVSTADMQPTVIQNSFTKILNTQILASQSSGYDFKFSEGLIKDEAFIELIIDIQEPAQDGWEVKLSGAADKHDIKITFTQSKKEVKVVNFANEELVLTGVDGEVFKKGLTKLYIEATSVGYQVTVNDKSLNDFNTRDDKGVELVKTGGFDTMSTISIKGLSATVKSLVVGSTRYQ